MTLEVGRTQLLRYRAHAMHLDDRVSSLAIAAHGGLQDSAPRSGVLSLHARARDVAPDGWEDPALAQIWFRGGADYVIPRADIGVFTLGASPRDVELMRPLEKVADDAIRVLDGRTLRVREVQDALALEFPFVIRAAAVTGRLLIRWNASMIWLIGSERPDVDPEDARLELARRFLQWFGPQDVKQFEKWAGTTTEDARRTWEALTPELVDVEVDGRARRMLERDVDALRDAAPVAGVRLLPSDDPFTKLDRDLLVADRAQRERVFPRSGNSPGYIPGVVLVDGEVAGVWQRQQRKVTVHPWRALPKDDVEREALSFPIAGKKAAEVLWN